MGSGAKSYMKKGFLIYSMRKCAYISPYVKWPLVIYDFAPDPSDFPYILGNFYFLFYQCTFNRSYNIDLENAFGRGKCPSPPLGAKTEPVFVNVYVAQESIPRSRFRQAVNRFQIWNF
jgi:hypothetical protein